MGFDFSLLILSVQGALINEGIKLISPQWADAYSIPICSGIMAGEAMMGALIAVLAVFGVLPGPDVCKRMSFYSTYTSFFHMSNTV